MGTTVEATAETGEPAQNSTINSIWYRWQAPSAGLFIFDTCGSDFDTYLSAFSGTAVNALTTLSQNDDNCSLQSSVAINAAAGEIFHLAVDGFGSGTGSVTLNYAPGNTELLVKDIRTGTNSSSPSDLTNVNGTLFFRAFDDTNGLELWMSDGTQMGTVLVKDIRTGASSSGPSDLTNVNGTLFFAAFDPTNGSELWMSDGTPMGTVLVKDIFPGANSSNPFNLTNVNGTLFFNADGGLGSELYATASVISNFTDVPPGSFGFAFIEDFFGAQITGGCALGNYCPNDPVTREQMAVFLEKAAKGPDFTPPPSIGLFDDVSIDSPFAPWIEQLFRDGITGGCGFNIYCPDQTVTRGQMAVFIEKALRGSDFAPPAATGIFNDVPASNGFAPWIEQLANDNITGGCGGGNYCPNNPVTRAQMAIFMGKAFDLGFVK